MATVDEIFARQAYVAGDDTWTVDNNYPSYTMYAEPEYVPATNKRIADFNDQVSIRGEQNTQFVGFQLPRYDDATDLTTQNLHIHYQTDMGGSDDVPCNVSYSDNYVRLCWMIPPQATQQPEAIQMMIYATGTNSVGDRTVWKTLPATYTIHDGLDIGGGIQEPDISWYEQFVQQMENKVSTAQGYVDDAAASKTDAAQSATASAESAAVAAKALEDNKAFVESQKETFIGYNKRETDLKYGNALIGKATGTGQATVKDAWGAPIPSLEILGGSTQVQTKGIQLFDATKIPSKAENGITITNNGDGSFTVNGTASTYVNSLTPIVISPGTYTVSAKCAGGTAPYPTIFRIRKNENGSSTDYELGKSFVVDSNKSVSYIAMIQADIRQSFNNFTLYPMLNVGSTALPWEPYTGGKATPSPEYPQPIISTGTATTGVQPLEVTLTGKMVGKNLCEMRLPKTIKDGLTYTPHNDGSFTLTGTNTTSATKSFRLNQSSDGGSDNLKEYPNGQYTLSITTEDDVTKLKMGLMQNNTWKVYLECSGAPKYKTVDIVDATDCFVYVSVAAGETVNITGKVQLERGTLTPWEPYAGYQITIPLTAPLHGIGDVRDRIMCRDWAWGVERWFNKKVYTGQESFGLLNEKNQNYLFNCGENLQSSIVGNTESYYCNYFVAGNARSNTDTVGSYVYTDTIRFRVGKDIATNSNEFKQWLLSRYEAGNPIIIIYPCATPTWEPFPDDVQQQLNTLTTYKGTTHISITTGGTVPDVAVEYVQDTNKVIADLQAQIDAIRNGGTK